MVTLTGVQVLFSIIIAGGTIFAFCWKYLYARYKKIKKEVEMMKELDQLLPAIKDILPAIKRMETQLYRNGGSSPIDAIDRIETSLKDVRYDLVDLKLSQRSFFDSMEVPYWVSDEEGHWVFVSNALCKLIGRNEEELKGNNWAAWLHPSCKNVFDIWNHSIENRIVFDQEEFIFRKNSNEWQKVSAFATHKIIDDKYAGSIGRLSKIGEPYKS